MTRASSRTARATGIDESLRLQQVYNIFLRYGMDFVFDRWVVGSFRRWMQQLLHHPEPPVQKLQPATKARLLLEELGPTYVKVGQLISSQSNVLPEDWANELSKLQNDVPPFSFEQVQEIVTDELGASPAELFESFDPTPLAAASLAQVHEARHEGGERVVVKVQRPDVQVQVTADLRIMRRGARFLSARSRWAREVGMVGVVDEFGANVVDELDYSIEAYNARRLARGLASIDGVGVPAVDRQLSTNRVLTLEYIEGVKITDVEAIDDADLEREQIADLALRAAIKMLLVDGFFHADPHPGNVLVNLESGRVTFLDTGMVGQLTVDQRLSLVKLLVVGQQNDLKGFAQALQALSVPFRDVDERAFHRDFERRLSKYLEPGEPAAFAEAMTVALEVLRGHGLRLDSQLTLAMKSLAQAAAFTSVLRPEASNHDFFKKGIDMVQELFMDQLNADRLEDALKQEATTSIIDLAQRIPRIRAGAMKWLEHIEEGQLTVKLDTGDLDRELRTVSNVSRSISLALILAGVVIGSAVAASVGSLGGEFLDFLPKFALVSYTVGLAIAAVVALVLVWRLYRQQSDDRVA